MPRPVNPLANNLARFLMFPDEFIHMHPSRRLDLLRSFQSNQLRGWGPLAVSHNKQLAIDKMRMSKRVNMQQMIDDPVRGGEWDWPLRLIARWSVATDVYAPRMYRLNKQCEYAWRLAVQTNEIDIKYYASNIKAYCRARDGAMERPVQPIASKFIEVHEARNIKKNEHLMQGWKLIRLTGAELRAREKNALESNKVEYMGALDDPDELPYGWLDV